MLQRWLLPALWIAYLGYWWAMARRVKATERREAPASRVTRAVMILTALALLALPHVPVPGLDARFLPVSLRAWWLWLGATVTATGLLFSAWARWRLGSNWSQAVTLKEAHELVVSGPYAIVRHPIYTGLLLGFLGCALALGEWRGLVAVVLVLVPLRRKLRLEDEWLGAEFGSAYEAYALRVAPLVPGIWPLRTVRVTPTTRGRR